MKENISELDEIMEITIPNYQKKDENNKKLEIKKENIPQSYMESVGAMVSRMREQKKLYDKLLGTITIDKNKELKEK